jgi:hypothetical protein
VRKLVRVFVVIVILTGVAFGPLAFGAAPSSSVTQAEAESFVTSFYRDLEGEDFDKFMAHFDQTVVYYNFGPKDRAYVANDLGQYCASYPSRSFTVGAITIKPVPNSDRVTVTFQIRFLIRNPVKDITRGGRTNVELDLAKRDGTLKVIRFDGSAVKDPAASPSP